MMKNVSKFAGRFERLLQICLFLLALSAPVSIAATQIFWSLALFFWLLRLIFVRPVLRKNAIDFLISAFVGLSFVSSIFSYQPDVSVRKMVPVLLVTIVYLVSEYTLNRKSLNRLVVILLISGVFTVAYTIGAFAVGKNLKVERLTENSILRIAGVLENDTILKANEISVNSPDELAAAVFAPPAGETAKILVYRRELLIDLDLPVGNLPDGDNQSKFGIVEWSRGRDTRASGTYGQYMTYSEVLQLLGSLAVGLLLAAPGGLLTRNRILLALCLGGFCLALLLTVTRASWAALAVSVSVLILIAAGRKTKLLCAACAIPLVLAGAFYLNEKRSVGFVDSNDDSTMWRLTVWREGFDLLVTNPRHLAVGIGMDSIKTHWREWHLFEDGKRPIGHMHCTPLQIALERGAPTFLIWLLWIIVYLKMVWNGLKRNNLSWQERGVLLGAFGGTVGFMTSGLVHYNWGDSEVVMVFYLIMGLSLAILRVINDSQTPFTGAAK